MTRERVAPRALLITKDPMILDRVLALAAAAGVDVEIADDPASARASWLRATIVIVGADLSSALARVAPARRDDVVVLAHGASPEVWQDAVALGAVRVLVAVSDDRWLVDRLADLDDGPARDGVVIAVVSGRGGAGASSLACGLAIAAARRGRRVLLVDADPLSPGLDVLMGIESVAGLRWSGITGGQGRIQASALQQALPMAHDVSVLACDADTERLDERAIDSVIGAGVRGYDVTIVDGERHVLLGPVLDRASHALVVVPSDVASVAAASRLMRRVRDHARAPEIVVRRLPRSDVDDALIGEALDCPVLGAVEEEPGLAADVDTGEAPGSRSRGSIARASVALLDAMGIGSVA